MPSSRSHRNEDTDRRGEEPPNYLKPTGHQKEQYPYAPPPHSESQRKKKHLFSSKAYWKEREERENMFSKTIRFDRGNVDGSESENGEASHFNDKNNGGSVPEESFSGVSSQNRTPRCSLPQTKSPRSMSHERRTVVAGSGNVFEHGSPTQNLLASARRYLADHIAIAALKKAPPSPRGRLRSATVQYPQGPWMSDHSAHGLYVHYTATSPRHSETSGLQESTHDKNKNCDRSGIPVNPRSNDNFEHPISVSELENAALNLKSEHLEDGNKNAFSESKINSNDAKANESVADVEPTSLTADSVARDVKNNDGGQRSFNIPSPPKEKKNNSTQNMLGLSPTQRKTLQSLTPFDIHHSPPRPPPILEPKDPLRIASHLKKVRALDAANAPYNSPSLHNSSATAAEALSPCHLPPVNVTDVKRYTSIYIDGNPRVLASSKPVPSEEEFRS